MVEEKRVAIVCSGGGMRTAYAGGALKALSQLGLKKPDIIVAASGSAGSAMYFVADQCEKMERVCTHWAPSRRFINPLRFWKVIDIDYLVDDVFKKVEPMNVVAARASETRYFIPIKNVYTKEIRYITNTDGIDLFEALRATKAMPVFYRRSVCIQDREYVDVAGQLSLIDLVCKAVAEGAERVIAVECGSAGASRKTAEVIEKNGRSVPVSLITNSGIPAHRLSNSKQVLRETFDLGHSDAVRILSGRESAT